MDRFPLLKEEPLSPKREGRFTIEEVSLSTDGGFPKFFHHPDIGAIRCQLAVDYEIDEGESEPITGNWYWRCADTGTWEEIDCPHIEIAADSLLNGDRKLLASLELWAAENSRIVLPKCQTAFEMADAR